MEGLGLKTALKRVDGTSTRDVDCLLCHPGLIGQQIPVFRKKLTSGNAEMACGFIFLSPRSTFDEVLASMVGGATEKSFRFELIAHMLAWGEASRTLDDIQARGRPI
jgi:hypothetical protein